MTQTTIILSKTSYIIMMLTRKFYSLFGAEEQLNTIKLSYTYSFAHGRFVWLLQVPNPWSFTLKCR